MEWYCSFQFKPAHATQIFIWDMNKQKQILLNANWDQEAWRGEAWFPVWRYVLEGFKPIPLEPPKAE